MRWSWKVADIAGIPVRVHVTFFLLLAWFFWMGVSRGLAGGVESVLFILAAFLCVVLHEFGHALTARRYGVVTRDITLLPIGGVARLDHFPRKPQQEVTIALMGPAVNVVIAAILYLVMRLSPNPPDFADPAVLQENFLARLFVFNVVVIAFNLIPAFPMDGGRVLRALLAMKLEYVRATRIAANIGQGLAFLFGILGLVANPMLILIAFFIFLAAGQESALVRMNSVFDGVPVRSAMITDFRALHAGEPITRAVELLLEGHQQDFPVLADGNDAIGILSRADLLKAIAGGRTGLTVGEAARRTCDAVGPDEMLESVFRRMQASGCSAVPVVEPGRGIVGMVTLENVGEFAMVQAALSERPRHAPA